MAATGLLSTVQPPTVPSLTQVPSAATITGGIPAAPNTTPANVATVAAPAAAAPRAVTEPETVSGQLNQLLSADSTYLQSARNRGLEQANQRGLINSSLAAGTAERAAIDAAMPIATQDATANATAGQSAQNANQDLGLTGYKSLLDSAQQSENFDYRTRENQQNIAANTQLQDDRLKSQGALQTQSEAAALAQQTQQQQANLGLQTTLKQMDISLDLQKLDATARDALTAATSPIVQQVQSEIAQIQRTPDEQMSAAAKADAIASQNAYLRTNLQTISTLYGYQLDWPNDSATVPSTRVPTEPRTTATRPPTDGGVPASSGVLDWKTGAALSVNQQRANIMAGNRPDGSPY